MQNFPKPANCWRIAHEETDGCTINEKELILCDITWMWSSNVHNHILYHFFCTRQRVAQLNELKECKQKIIFFFPKRHEDSTVSARLGCIIDCPRLT
jgi:hypothetical protein